MPYTMGYHRQSLFTSIFDVGQLDDIQRSMLVELASYIVSVYIPSFFCIHLKPSFAEEPGIVLFQRNLLLA